MGVLHISKYMCVRKYCSARISIALYYTSYYAYMCVGVFRSLWVQGFGEDGGVTFSLISFSLKLMGREFRVCSCVGMCVCVCVCVCV